MQKGMLVFSQTRVIHVTILRSPVAQDPAGPDRLPSVSSLADACTRAVYQGRERWW